MLDFDLSEEQQILRESVREFAEKEIRPRAEKLDEAEEFSLDLVKKMAELGLFGMFVSEEYGGAAPATSRTSSRSRSSRGWTARGGDRRRGELPRDRTDLLLRERGAEDANGSRACAAARSLASFGLTEPNAGSDAGGSKTTAVLEGRRWIDQRQQDLHHERLLPDLRDHHRAGENGTAREREERALAASSCRTGPRESLRRRCTER